MYVELFILLDFILQGLTLKPKLVSVEFMCLHILRYPIVQLFSTKVFYVCCKKGVDTDIDNCRHKTITNTDYKILAKRIMNRFHDMLVERGVRQGCPVSAALYILAISPLIKLINCESLISGTCVGPLCRFTAIACADYITVIIKKSVRNGRVN